jgi:DNA-binding NarL/FixJ family response regulator
LADLATEGTRTVAILADDLIWSTRLSEAVQGTGARAMVVRRLADLEQAVGAQPGSPHATDVIVDLTARAYDGVAAIRVAREAGARVIAVGQHDDAAMRRAATAAGAERVFTYRALFDAGPRLLASWLAR